MIKEDNESVESGVVVIDKGDQVLIFETDL